MLAEAAKSVSFDSMGVNAASGKGTGDIFPERCQCQLDCTGLQGGLSEQCTGRSKRSRGMNPPDGMLKPCAQVKRQCIREQCEGQGRRCMAQPGRKVWVPVGREDRLGVGREQGVVRSKDGRRHVLRKGL